MSRECFSFVIYLLHACADDWGRSPSEVYRLLSSVDCINSYLVPFYDILHTQGTGYLVDDIKEFLRLRGVTV